MYMRRFIQVLTVIFFLVFPAYTFSAGISSGYSSISKAFDIFTNKHEGETSFRSLFILGGGRMEGLGGAFTALANDITFFEANPASSSSLKNTELAFLHNSWIADSRIETLSFSMRSGNLGYGASLRCFYIPFTEYDSFGEKASSGYYSETFSSFNISYNFLAGYKFKGLALGSNIKFGILSMPPYSGQENETLGKKERREKALKQQGYAFLGDFGLQIRADVFKRFNSREPNFYFGLALKNIGVPIKGDIPPSAISAGFAYRPVKIFLFAVDVTQPINVKNIKASEKAFGSAGMMFTITKYFNLLTGFGIKGGNPRFSLGGEVNLANIQINANYLLDLSSQTTALNHISLGAKISIGDRGREKEADKLEHIFLEGLKLYQQQKYNEAILVWKTILQKNPYFEPALNAIRTAERQIRLEQEIKKIQELEL